MNKFWISIILLLLFRPLLSERYAHFDHYTTEDGMISNRITSITQDSLGYIWMATDFGLERFDGKRFKHYQKKEYPKLIRNDFHGVKYVHNNKIMICGYNGMLMEYDIEKDEFYDIKPKDFEENYYKEIGGIYKNEKWEYLMTGSGIYIYDKEKEVELDFKERPYRFVDAESGEEVKITPSQLKDRYYEAVKEKIANIRAQCNNLQIDFVQADINKGFDQIMLPFLIKRSRLK